MEKKTAVKTIMIASATRRLRWNSPQTRALAILTTGVKGIIQLMVCTILGKEDSGKNTPLKKNIGVINRVNVGNQQNGTLFKPYTFV